MSVESIACVDNVPQGIEPMIREISSEISEKNELRNDALRPGLCKAKQN